MSIFSKIGSAVKKVASKVGGLFGGGSNSAQALNYNNPANNALQAAKNVNQSIAPNMSTPYGAGYVDSKGNLIITGAGGKPNLGATIVANTPAPQTTISRSFGVSGSWAPTTPPSGSPTAQNANINISPQISATSLGGAGVSSSSGTGVSAPGTTSNSAPSMGYPSTPNYTDVGPVDLAGTASTLPGLYALNPKTGQLEPVTDASLEAERKKTAESIKSLIPKKDNLFDNAQIQAQQAEVQRRQQEVNNYTAQLNSIVAKQNADLLQLRGIGSQEGVTEAVYGGQQAQINREAAIKALPIQAQIAAAQGNLELAQQHLTDLVKIVSENIDNDYTYRKAQFDWASQYATGEDKIKLEKLNKMADRAYAAQKDTVDFAQSLMLKAVENGQAGIATSIGKLLQNPNSPTLVSDLNRLVGQVGGGGGTVGNNFVDIMQDEINNGASPESAARTAAAVSEASGVQVDQKTLSSFIEKARTLKKGQVLVRPVGPMKSSYSGANIQEATSSFFNDLFGG